MRLKGEVALITGAAGGIGKGIAMRFAEEGARVIVSDADVAEAQRAAAEIAGKGGDARALGLDVTKPEEIATTVADISKEFGRLDILVNNAGVTSRVPFLSMTLDFWERVLRINLTGAMLCSQAAARAMIKGGRGGRIVNVASISGQRGGSERAAYGASKAGLINLTAVMALELAPHGINVNAIAPGPTDVGRPVLGDPAQARASLSRMAIKRSALPAEIAVAAVFLAERENTMVTGHVLNVDGGFNASGIVYDQ
ncbi:MAG TPA: glucose 1-dehydrogenase [Alphaproteobacteria bacterium]|nr:glucose 1-dehydrogenase [Alphaproteobacteria bacterium]